MFDYSTIPIGYYDGIFNRRAGIQSKWHHLKFSLFAEQLTARSTHLDIGCGPGTFIGLLPSGQHSVGVDIAQEQIAYATTDHSSETKTFLRVDRLPYPFPDGSFDAVTIIELLEHLSPEDGIAVLNESYRLLAPGGSVFVSTPNYSSLWPLVERIVNRMATVSYRDQHITQYTPAKLLGLLRAAKFGPSRCQAYQGFSFLGAAIHWRLPDFLQALERHITFSRYGLLLFAVGTKPVCR